MRAIALLIISIGFPGIALAASEGQHCGPEPTDEVIEYGDIRICEIDPGDTDWFSFFGEAGEQVVVVVSGTEADKLPSAKVCIEVFPGHHQVCDETTLGWPLQGGIIELYLEHSGEYAIRVTETRAERATGYSLMLDRAWPASPVAEFLEPGDVIHGTLDPAAEIDMYVFEGSKYDIVRLTVTEGDESPASPDVCTMYYQPFVPTPEIPDYDRGYSIVDWTCDETGKSGELQFDTEGPHIVLIAERHMDQPMDYTLEYQCVRGECKPAQRVVCDVETTQTSYVDGEKVTVDTLRLANVGSEPVVVDVRTWFELPSGGVFPGGIDVDNVSLPAGFDTTVGPFPLFTVRPDQPRGAWEYKCRLLKPTSGATRALDGAPFELK